MTLDFETFSNYKTDIYGLHDNKIDFSCMFTIQYIKYSQCLLYRVLHRQITPIRFKCTLLFQ